MSTPNDQNFDGFPNDSQATGIVDARTLGSFVVEGHRTDPGGEGDLSTVVYDASAVGVSIGSGKMLGLNYGAIYTADWWQFRSVSATDNFKLASLEIESSSFGWDDLITVSGYNDGGLAVSATVNLTAGGTYGLIGGDGIDTVVYSGRQSDYRFLLGKDGLLHVEDTASGDLDTLGGIEKGAFSDGTIGLSFTQADPKLLASVALLYQVVLDRAADAGGFDFWLGSYDDSTHMARIFIESAEFKQHYGALDDAHFVATLLANSGVTAGDGGAAWETWLGTHTRAELVVALIADASVVSAQFGTQGLWLV